MGVYCILKQAVWACSFVCNIGQQSSLTLCTDLFSFCILFVQKSSFIFYIGQGCDGLKPDTSAEVGGGEC